MIDTETIDEERLDCVDTVADLLSALLAGDEDGADALIGRVTDSDLIRLRGGIVLFEAMCRRESAWRGLVRKAVAG